MRTFLFRVPLLMGVAMALFLSSLSSFSATVPSLASVLEPIRAQYKLPALAGAIFTPDGIVEMAAVGVRKAGMTVPVTTGDLWHLGSDTKMMTATLAGTFVAEKKLDWNDKIVSFFPEIAGQVPASRRDVTLAQVLSHRAGLIENLDWNALSQSGSLSDQRLQAAHLALLTPASAPGTFHYSNADYVVIGAVLEKIGHKPWEDLIRERIFAPLGMDSAGFGGTGTLGKIDQPWPHFDQGVPAPVNGPAMDNREVMGPAGSVHCTMTDWAKFLIDQLRGAAGLKATFPAGIYHAMQTAAPSSDYGYGWLIVERPWAGGKALTHSGSNTMNYCVCWLAPARKFGVLVCTNQGGDAAFKASDAAASALILRSQAPP